MRSGTMYKSTDGNWYPIERVIVAWETFRDSNPYGICSGKEFRAIREPEYCMGQMIEDTLELLKEQEAKLLTFDEVKKHYSIPDELIGNLMESIDYSFDIAPLYMECPDEDQWVVHWRDYRSIEPFLEGWREDYGKTWRCWTTKPTAEQRSAAKWN